MFVVINPGTGPCIDTEEKNAIKNIKKFINDCEVKGLRWKRKKKLDYGEGRYAFIIKAKKAKWEIQMPGLKLERVRYMNEPGQNIWHYPRLYVNGNSYVWYYARISQEKYKDILNEA